MMKDKIAFLAVGQAGGNIGQLLEEKGYSVLYINTSNEDLKIIKGGKYKYHITGGEGCNKDRKKAKKLVIDDFDKIMIEIETKISADFLFVIFSSGGGTGSGAGPMLIDLLVDENKDVGAITILPNENESIKAQINSYECLVELESIEQMRGVFIIDNNKGNKLDLNKPFVDAFDSFITIPEKHSDIRGNIDPSEIEETLKAHGMAIVIQNPGNSADIISAVEHENIFAPIEKDQIVQYLALSIHSNVLREDIEKIVGTPLDYYITYNKESTICCVSGLSYPMGRIERIQKKIEDNRESILRNLNSNKESKLKKGINFLDDIEKKEVPDTKKPKSRRDILSKYL
jgi:cell division GTPase FtsZ